MKTLEVMTWQEFAANNGMEQIHALEEECWAPWLAANPESLDGRADIFPEGQLCLPSELGLLATLSVNKIDWDGELSSLPTWDEVAGDPTTYEHTVVPEGNTLCLMSMNVSQLGRGKKLPKLLIDHLLDYADSTGVEHVIGSFRPSGYSEAVLAEIQHQEQPSFVHPLPFEEYCQMTNEKGEPVDPWLRSLNKNGMQPLQVDHSAMVIPVSFEEFDALQQPNWKTFAINGIHKQAIWCGETGFFQSRAEDGFVVGYEYRESNLWGKLK